MNKKIEIGIIGYGNMGSAIAERLKRENITILVFDKNSERTKMIHDIDIAEDNIDLVQRVEVVILAVKPQDFDVVMSEIKNVVNGNLIISIAAGVITTYIERILGSVKVIRVMPNLPAKIGEGIICLCKGKFATENDLCYARDLFDYLGKTIILKEDLMNAATAVSGSGPGFFYALICGKDLILAKKFAKKEFFPALCKAAESIGFSKRDARELASVTAQGSVKYLEKSGLDAETLKKQVASKGGTTEAGLIVLEKGGSFEDAVKAALKRAEELSKE